MCLPEICFTFVSNVEIEIWSKKTVQIVHRNSPGKKKQETVYSTKIVHIIFMVNNLRIFLSYKKKKKKTIFTQLILSVLFYFAFYFFCMCMCIHYTEKNHLLFNFSLFFFFCFSYYTLFILMMLLHIVFFIFIYLFLLIYTAKKIIVLTFICYLL